MNKDEGRAAALAAFRVYTLSELEPILGVTHRTLLTYVKTGRLAAVKMGGQWKVSEDNLKAFINGERPADKITFQGR